MSANRREVVFMALLVILCAFCQPIGLINALGEEPEPFPSATRLKSPDGRYSVKSFTSEEGGTRLILKDRTSGEKRMIYSLNATATLLWSPKSDKLIINDHGDSNWANCIVYFIDGNRKIDVAKELEKVAGENRNTIFKNDHVYIEGTAWLNDDSIRLKIYGHGDIDPMGFTLWYGYQLGGVFKLIKRVNTDYPK